MSLLKKAPKVCLSLDVFWLINAQKQESSQGRVFWLQ